MRVAVITPYFREPEAWIRLCAESVRLQTHSCTHFLVADGEPRAFVDELGVRHVALDASVNDSGNTPRAVGSALAVSEEYDAIAFLDADCLYHAGHIEGLIAAQRNTGAVVGSTYREMCHMETLRVIGLDYTEETVACDTNCMIFFRGAFELLKRWSSIPRELAGIGDRVVWHDVVVSDVLRVRLRELSVAYRCRYAYSYEFANVPVPEGARPSNELVKEEEQRWLAQGGLPIEWAIKTPKKGGYINDRVLSPGLERIVEKGLAGDY